MSQPFDIEKLLSEAKGQEKAQLELAAVLQAALANPTETTIYNTCALGWAAQDDGTAVLMVGLLGGRQLRFMLSKDAVAQLHQVSTGEGGDAQPAQNSNS